jgi:hypothetical protein
MSNPSSSSSSSSSRRPLAIPGVLLLLACACDLATDAEAVETGGDGERWFDDSAEPLALKLPDEPARASQDALAACNQILSQGVFTYHETSFSYDEFRAKAASACRILDTWSATDRSQFSQECGGSTEAQEVDVAVNIVYGKVPVGGSGGWETTKEKWWCNTGATASAYRQKFHSSYCGSSQTTDSLETSWAEVLRVADQNIVEAWSDCIQLQKDLYGLFCYGRRDEHDDSISFHVDYKRGPLMPDIIDLDWEQINTKPQTALDPQMGEGNLIESLAIADGAETSKIIVTGSAEGAGQVTCAYQLAPIEGKMCVGRDVVGTETGRLYQSNSSLCPEPLPERVCDLVGSHPQKSNDAQHWMLAPTENPGEFWIVNRRTNQPLDFRNNGEFDVIIQYPTLVAAAKAQRWHMEPVGDDHVRLVNEQNGKVLDAVGMEEARPLAVLWEPVEGGEVQHWRVEDAGGGFVMLRNRYLDKVLDYR